MRRKVYVMGDAALPRLAAAFIVKERPDLIEKEQSMKNNIIINTASAALSHFATAASMLLASFMPEHSLEDAEMAVLGLRRKKPSRGQYWAKTNHVEDRAYHRQPPTKSATGPKESPRKMVPVKREVFVDASRYPAPNKLINVPKHLRRAAA